MRVIIRNTPPITFLLFNIFHKKLETMNYFLTISKVVRFTRTKICINTELKIILSLIIFVLNAFLNSNGINSNMRLISQHESFPVMAYVINKNAIKYSVNLIQSSLLLNSTHNDFVFRWRGDFLRNNDPQTHMYVCVTVYTPYSPPHAPPVMVSRDA